MAKYTNQDQRNLEELLEEGFMDRFKARGSQALGAVKGAAQQLKGGAQQFAGNAVQKAGDLASKGVQAVGGQIDPSQNKLTQKGQNMSKAGQENIQAGGQQAEQAKIESYKNSAQKNIQKLVSDIQNDLTKLGINIDTKKMQQFSKSMATSLVKALDIFKGQSVSSPEVPQESQVSNDPYSRMRARASAPEAEEDMY